MKFFLRCAWPCWGVFLCCLQIASGPVAAQVGTGSTVQKIEIRHVGPPAASDELIRANIRVKVGETYNRTGVDDDVRTLYSTGLFYNIRVAEERIAGGVNLLYVVQGKPTLTDIRFEGNKKFSNKKLLKKITSKTGEPLNEQKLFTDSQEIQKMYQKAGYQKTEVKADPRIDDQTGRGRVTFEIKETPKVKIADVEFVGAQAFKQRKLRKTIKTRRHWMFSWITGSGVLKDEQFEEDKDKLAGFYRNEGYIDFELKEVKLEYKNPKRMTVRFFVSEGRQYKVGAVEVKGNKLFTSDEILKGANLFAKPEKKQKGLRLAVGKTFTPKGLTDDLQAIEDFYGSKGYIDVRVVADKNPNTEKGTMDLVYEILNEDKGQSYIEKIEIRGNTKTRDKVIRRELAVSPGEVFDMVRVKRSKGRLEQMQYFDKVETEIDPTDIPDRKNLIIGVEEGSTGNFELGAGFSSVDNLVGFIGYREGNFDLFNPPTFRGGGQKFRINIQLGTRRKDYVLSFIEPWFLGRKLAFGTELYHKEVNYYSDLYDITQTGGRLSLTRTLGSDFLIGSVSYTLENIGIKNVDQENAPQLIKDEPSDRLVSKIGGSLAYDTRNSVFLADRGQRTELFSEVASSTLGGDTDFYKARISSIWYFPGFFSGHIWELLGQAGVVDNYGDTSRVPLFDRYFLGGVTSLRGFKYRRVGPRYHQVDPVTGVDQIVNDEPIGGEMYWLGSVEYSLPIIERLRFAVFYDIGNVYENAYSFSLAPGQRTYSDDWGVGFRLNIPRLGPLRLDYAFPISHDDGISGSGKFQFSVGFQRDF
ncbi:MAG: outer membrane protein assembly factor BamA [Verrucomicrobiales bacterium]|nr:outer membrane protein assembly factor BamA [Verrucomicrobiales bacterium]